MIVSEKIEEPGHSPPFDVALSLYSRTHGCRDLLRIRYSTREDVVDAIDRTENIATRKRSRGTRSCLVPLITFLDKYSKAMDVFVQVSSGFGMNPTALAWGLIRILLETASSMKRYIDGVLTLLEEAGSIVTLYSEYDILFPESGRFQSALTDVYADIIMVLSRACKVLKASGFKAFLRCFKGSFETEFRDDIGRLRRHATLLGEETTLAHRTQLLTLASHQDHVVEQIAQDNERNMGVEQQQRVLRWLAPFDCDSRLAEIGSTRHKGTCSWFLQNSVYTDWKERRSNSWLWVSGGPGVGKSVLSCAIIADIREATSSSPMVLYFHCDAGNDRARSKVSLYASLISQIAAQSPHFPQALAQAYETAARSGRTLISIADDPEDLFRRLLGLTKQVYLVIDGLDEMEVPSELVDGFTRIGTQAKCLQIVFLSRDVSHIRKTLVDLPRVDISASEVGEDINLYVRAASATLPVTDDHVKQEIVNEISRKANGMFLWAHMVLLDLSTATCVGQMKDMLSQCPPGLNAVYGHFLSNLAKQAPGRQSLAVNILQWTCCATRALSVAELEAALASVMPETMNDETRKPLRSVLLDICSPFIGLSADGKHVLPIHQSIREYLLSSSSTLDLDSKASSFLVEEQAANGRLALGCITYIKRSDLNFERISQPSDGFWSYAMLNWCHHTAQSSYDPELSAEIRELLSNPKTRQELLYQMLFRSNDPFPFLKVFRLQSSLANWYSSGKRAKSVDEHLSVSTWCMDVMELLFRLDEFSENQKNTYVPSTVTEISYFNKMMVVRDLARRLTQADMLGPAVSRLETIIAGQPWQHWTAQTSWAANTLAILYDQQGHASLSLRTHESALLWQESRLGHTHPSALWTVNELGRVHRHLGALDASAQMHLRALVTLTESLPPDHPERIWTTKTLAMTRRKQGRAAEALQLQQEAYGARCESLGADHPHTLWSCVDVGKCHRDLGVHGEALAWFTEAYEGRARVLGAGHPDTLWALNEVGLELAALGRKREAVEAQRRALEGQVEVLGVEHEHARWTKEVLEELLGGSGARTDPAVSI